MKIDLLLYSFLLTSISLSAQSNIDVGELNNSEKEQVYKEPWFTKKYEHYVPKIDFSETLMSQMRQSRIHVFMGTWCHDTKILLPKVIKLFDLLDIPKDHITIYNVDEDKQQPKKPLKKNGIQYLPTIIFFDGDREIGRIVEYPLGTLEEDISKIYSESKN